MTIISASIMEEAVKKYLISQKKNPDVEISCHNFKAGKTSTSNKSEFIDENGLGGTMCNHNIPLDFANVKGGEKFVLLILGIFMRSNVIIKQFIALKKDLNSLKGFLL